jgi:hypothetical protein
MSNDDKTLINKIFSWALVKGSGDVTIDESIFLSGIVLIANGEDSDGEETSIIEARVILGEQDSEIIIHREEELFDEWAPEISDGIVNKVYDSKNFETYLPKILASELLQVAFYEDPDYLTEYNFLIDDYVYEEGDSSYFSEIEDGDDETIMVGSFARYIELDESEAIDINDQDKINKLSNKLCKSVIALGNCKKDVDGFDSDGFQWTGVHLVPLPDQ